MSLEALAKQSGEWLRGCGPESDIVMSSRIRLARNLADFSFIRRCTDIDRANIEANVRGAIQNLEQLSNKLYIDVAQLEALDRQFLVERQLISRELSEANGARAVVIDPLETFSVMINEEDHLRLQVMKSGLDLEAAWEQANLLDDQLEDKLTFAFDEKLGYLTACPTNVGTGLRVSVMLHLPALVMTHQIEKVFRSLQKINLAVRGLYGEGSQAMGDCYQISNQITLGRSENDLIKQVSEIVPVVIEYERKARNFLLDENATELRDQIGRAFGTLCNAQQISSEETMHLLSKVRLGVNLGFIKEVDASVLNQLFIHTQPAHLQKMKASHLNSADRNMERAKYLQLQLRPFGPSDEKST